MGTLSGIHSAAALAAENFPESIQPKMPAKEPEHCSFKKKREQIASKTVRKVFPLGESKAGVNTTDSHRRSRVES
jgi:hypothetical protein